MIGDYVVYAQIFSVRDGWWKEFAIWYWCGEGRWECNLL